MLPVMHISHSQAVLDAVNAVTADPKEDQLCRHLSRHYHGYRATGKTCFLQLVGEELLRKEKIVYFFGASNQLEKVMDELVALNERLMVNNERAYLLVDESQMSPNAFFPLLRELHNIITIAAGRVALDTASHNFDPDLVFHAEVLFFSRSEFNTEMVSLTRNMAHEQKTEFASMLSLVFGHTGGHAYSTMKLAQDMATKAARGDKFEDVKDIFWDPAFIHSPLYTDVLGRASFFSSEEIRLVPLVLRHLCGMSMEAEEMMLINKFSIPQAPTVLKRALLYKHGLILPEALSQASFNELVVHCLLQIETRVTAYEKHGGAIERSMVYEMCLLLHACGVLDGAPLYELAPGAGTGRVDLRVNSRFKMYVEALVVEQASRGTKTAQGNLLAHINRFLDLDGLPAQYQLLGCSDFRLLSFQRLGATVEGPDNEWTEDQENLFHSKVLTWLMETKKLYLGYEEVLPATPTQKVMARAPQPSPGRRGFTSLATRRWSPSPFASRSFSHVPLVNQPLLLHRYMRPGAVLSTARRLLRR